MPHRTAFLSRVRLERFKAAFKPDPVELQPFNVIIGRNGSGKSTLLEALQWLDTTIRRDAREACDRYHGSRDLMNLRSQSDPPYFRLELLWKLEARTPFVHYRVRVEDHDGVPFIGEESLVGRRTENGKNLRTWVKTLEPGRRELHLNGGMESRIPLRAPDRLALRDLEDSQDPILEAINDFWTRAVFLRLSPNRLQEGSPATRKSFEPLLDEEGQALPALLNELDDDQRADLVEAISQILPGIRDVNVSKADLGRDTRVHYSLLERMPYRGRSGRTQFPIPAWMLSEGTRRITAILALLQRDPPPSLLCIEEIENGLDPWTVLAVLAHLQSASELGTQVLVTSHSPWLLDHVPMDSILFVERVGGDTTYRHFASLEEIQRFQAAVPPGTRYIHAENQRSQDE